MTDVRKLSEEIAGLEKMIQSFEGQLNEIRQQREFKLALLRELQSQKLDAVDGRGSPRQEDYPSSGRI
jgi:hypothetical protein